MFFFKFSAVFLCIRNKTTNKIKPRPSQIKPRDNATSFSQQNFKPLKRI